MIAQRGLSGQETKRREKLTKKGKEPSKILSGRVWMGIHCSSGMRFHSGVIKRIVES